MKKRSNLAKVYLLYATLLIWLGMSCATFTKVAPAADITGTWKTGFETSEGTLEVFLHIQKSPEGTLAATIDAPGMDAYDIPLVISFDNGIVHYEIESVGVSFDGKLIDPSTIEGTSSRVGGDSISAIYKRVR